KTEQALLARHLDLRSDIIVKGQHHSEQSGSEAFLDAARPRLIIASSRDFPDHERISDSWIEELQERGIKLFRQDQTGAVTLRFRHDGWEAQSYFTGEIFRSTNQLFDVPFWRKISSNLHGGSATATSANRRLEFD